jgi:hypothetical protein
MRDKVKPRNIHVPVRYVAGVWECELGGPVPVVEGAVARLSISASDISGSAFLEAMNRPAKHRVLGEGATFRIALTIKPGTPLSPELHKHLISYRQIKHQIATEEFLDSFGQKNTSDQEADENHRGGGGGEFVDHKDPAGILSAVSSNDAPRTRYRAACGPDGWRSC